MTDLRMYDLLSKELLSKLGELDLQGPIYPSWECLEMNDDLSFTVMTSTMWCGNLPCEYAEIQWESTRLKIECRYADICTGCLLILSTILTTVQQTQSSAAWQRLQYQIQCQISFAVTQPKKEVLTISPLGLGDHERLNRNGNHTLQ